MSISSKFLKLNQNVLLQWTFNSDDLVSENYQVLSNLNAATRTFISDSTSFNSLNNTSLEIDPVVNKYTKADLSKYNFLQVQSYSNPLIPYDTVRMYFPSSFNFLDDGYSGLILKISAYDYYNKKLHYFSQYFFDNEDSTRQIEIKFGTPFLYDEQTWSKYIEIKIPNIDHVSKQRITSDLGVNTPIPDSINYNLTNGIGISDTTPIILEFRLINGNQISFGTKYFFTTNPYNTSLSKTPDFLGLACQIQESTQGDYFEINGTYAGSKENLDDYINYIESQGQKIRVEYDVSLFEENILQRTQTFVITENFTQTILYRPIITFSNTTAFIQVTMRIIDLINGSTTIRISSVGLTANLFKYSAKLSRINIDGAFKPKIYNLKQGNNKTNTTSGQPQINTVKVNYPLLIDTYKILAGSSNSTNTSYRGLGLLEIIINPYRNVIKFKIASDVDNSGNAVPYDLSQILLNSKLIMSFKNDSISLEKEIFYESNDNDYKNGIVVFSIDENEVPTIKKIKEDNNRFYIVLKSNINNARTLLYYGTFQLLENIKSVDLSTGSVSISTDTNTTLSSTQTNEASTGNATITTTDVETKKSINGKGTIEQSKSLNSSTPTQTPILPNKVNLLLFLDMYKAAAGNVQNNFENELGKIVDYKKQVHSQRNYTYFIIGLTISQVAEIKKLNGVDNKYTNVIPVDIGKVSEVDKNQSSQINSIIIDSNKIGSDWIKTVSTYNAATGLLSGPPTNIESNKLLSLITPNIKKLNSLGYKLDQNKNTITKDIWVLSADDGKGSYIPGLGYKNI